VATLLASSWDAALAGEVGKSMGAEAKAYGIDYILAPALNIHRNPLGGRNFEYFSEDPLLSGSMAAALVNGIESNGVGSSVKHFAANNQETNRNQINTIVSERALREIYLRGFEIVVRGAQPWTVMSSYNKINGTYTSEDPALLSTILRKEWGFRGFVMTDWFGGTNPAAQMQAGNDLLMPGTPEQVKQILQAVQEGRINEALLAENAARILAVSMQGQSFSGQVPGNQPALKAHAQTARQAAAAGAVLLKNQQQTLPMSPSVKTLAAFGVTSYAFIAGGTGSGDVNEAYTVSLVDGMQQAGFNFEKNLQTQYEQHIAAALAKRPKPRFFFELPPPLPEMSFSESQLTQAAAIADLALITIGRNSGEFQDRHREGDFEITAEEQALIAGVSTAFRTRGKRVVVVLNIGGVIETASWRHHADAILLAWQGGQEAGHAVADLLTGKVNPSGKLPMSFPLRYEDVPSAKNFPGRELSDQDVKGVFGMSMGKPSEVVYEEGIYVGYRYYNSYKVPVAFPFGFGLSYTEFSYSPLQVQAQDGRGNLRVSLKVTNTGKLAGQEVVQLYVSAPGLVLDKPAQELKAFGKTRLLQPGESQTLQFILTPRDLASYHSDLSAWVVEKGTYTLYAGASALDLRQDVKAEVNSQVVAEQCNRVMVPQVTIQEWKGRK
jgi:beta-glucosidase